MIKSNLDKRLYEQREKSIFLLLFSLPFLKYSFLLYRSHDPSFSMHKLQKIKWNPEMLGFPFGPLLS